MSKQFSERILDYMERPDYVPMKARKLARALSIGDAEHGDFHDAVDALRRVGRVVIGSQNSLMLPHSAGMVIGVYRANPRGFGFVVPEETTTHGDLYIGAGDALDAVTGDTVMCRVVKRGKRDGRLMFGGKIVKVIERGESRFVGELDQQGDHWFVMPDGKSLHVPIFIGDPGAKSARKGDQVVVEITQYPGDGKTAQGVIVERIGEKGRPGVDLLSVIRQHHLPEAFPPEVIRETQAIVRGYDIDAERRTREDLTGRVVLTIDPDEARDFDDAISLERLAGGQGWELGVHIADVSAFVRPGTLLDEEAEERGTSVYLPGHVIPMLPEVLSNGLCSLQEGEPRLTKSVFIRYDEKAKVLGSRFANTVIKSTKRLTYRQATAILDGDPGPHGASIVELVHDMNALARRIQKRRLAQGMIVLELPAVDLILNADGEVVDARPEDTSFSHTIIEMFMVEANEAAALLMYDLGVPCLRRIHPDPDEDALAAMARFLAVAKLPKVKNINVDSIQNLLQRLRGQPQSYAVNLAVLKSMQMAEYAPDPIGHFALASKHYAHFTSPIRRYPDLMLHRLLDRYIRGDMPKPGRKRKKGPPEAGKELKEAGRRMSFLSRRADAAEQELKMVKVLALLEGQLGETFDGVVTGVTSFGLFVQHPVYLVDGLLRIDALGDDWWEADLRRGRIYGERTRKVYTLGNVVDVRIVSVDVAARRMDLALTHTEPRKTGRSQTVKTEAPPSSKRKRSGPRKGESGKSRRRRKVKKKTS